MEGGYSSAGKSLVTSLIKTKRNSCDYNYSRHERKRRLLSKNDSMNSKIDDFFPTLHKIECLIRENQMLKTALNMNLEERFRYTQGTNSPGHTSPVSQSFTGASSFTSNYSDVSDMLKQLWLNASSKNKRHSEIVKKFSVALFILSGSMAYSLLSLNFPLALPSLRQVRRYITDERKPLVEGELRVKELKAHLILYNVKHHNVAISEDATRIIQRIDYDSLQTVASVLFDR